MFVIALHRPDTTRHPVLASTHGRCPHADVRAKTDAVADSLAGGTLIAETVDPSQRQDSEPSAQPGD